MRLYKHKSSRDTAIKIDHIFEEDALAVVDFYNIFYYQIGESSVKLIGSGVIHINDLSEYEVLDI